MSGPKTSEWRVVSEAELRRREDESRRRSCETMSSRLDQMNQSLFFDIQVESPSLANDTNDTHQAIKDWETALNESIKRAQTNMHEQRETEVKCRLMVKKIKRMGEGTSNPNDYIVNSPEITSMKKLKEWEGDLIEKIKEAEYKNERDVILLRNKAAQRLDLSNVDLSMKEKSRIEEIRTARRMDKLQKLAESISEIEDETIRESLVLESVPLLNEEHDKDFDEAVIKLNTRVRGIKKAQQRRKDAFDEVAKIQHLKTAEARQVCALAESVGSSDDLARIKRKVTELLDLERRKQDERFVRKAIRETLVELGYDYGEGFTQTEFGPVAYAEKDSGGDYALRIQMSDGAPNIFSRIVSCDETTAEQDKAAEENLCADFHEMMRGLKERGIETVLTRELQPGEHPVEKMEIDDRNQIAKARRRRRAAATSKRRNV